VIRYIAAALLLSASAASANGAFPDSMAILLSEDHPRRLVVATNFGLIVSEDAGGSWRWVCEEVIGARASLYFLGPAPARKLLGVSLNGLAVSSDGACSWERSGGALAGAQVNDAAPHPVDSQAVLALARREGLSGVYASSDGALSFSGPSYTAPAGTLINSVEISPSDDRTRYLTLIEETAFLPSVARSTNAGESWTVIDASAVLGARTLRIMLIDPADPKRLYLRAIDLASRKDQVIVSIDGAATFQSTLELPEAMTAFLRRANGELIAVSRGGSYVSKDRGMTWSPSPISLHVRALGELGGKLYAVADNFADGFAVGVSENDGSTWTPLLKFNQICGVLECGELPTVCAEPWARLRTTLGMPADPCGLAPPPPEKPAGCGCGADGLEAVGAVFMVALLARRRRLRGY
jgi:hypothetical protein